MLQTHELAHASLLWGTIAQVSGVAHRFLFENVAYCLVHIESEYIAEQYSMSKNKFHQDFLHVEWKFSIQTDTLCSLVFLKNEMYSVQNRSINYF